MIRIEIAKAYTELGFETAPKFGMGYFEEELDEITDNKVKRYISIINKNPETDQIMSVSRGLIDSGTMIMIVFGKRPRQVYEDMKSWMDLLYISELDGQSAKPNAPFNLGSTVRFWKFRPVGSLNGEAEKFGTKYWFIDQLIDFSAKQI